MTQAIPQEQTRKVSGEMRPSYGPLARMTDKVIGVEGNRGTGKTYSILTELVDRSLEYPGARIVLARLDRTELSKTILTTFEEDVLPSFGMSTPGGQSRDDRTVYDMPNGSQFIPIGLRNGGGALSFEATFAYAAEITEPGVTKKMVTDLIASLRYTKRANRPTLPKWTQLIGDFNPVAPSHWVNRWFEPVSDELRKVVTMEDYTRLQKHNWRHARDPKRAPKRIITRHMDNPYYWNWNRWDFEDPGREYIQETLSMLSGFQRDRWLLGLWKAAEGSVFAEAFSEARNVIEGFPLPASWPVWVYVDFGEDHPACAAWYTIAPASGKKICFGLIHGRKIGGVANLAAMILEKNRLLGVVPDGYYGDPRHGFATTFQATSTIAEQFAEHGIPNMRPWGRQQGKGATSAVELIRTALATGDLLIVRDCQAAIDEIQAWSYKRTADGSVPNGDDAFEDANNDFIDTLRGFMTGRHEPGGEQEADRPQHPAGYELPETEMVSAGREAMRD